MTFEERQYVRQRISELRKRQTMSVQGQCAGCGCEREERTTGCRNCMKRATAREKRGNRATIERNCEWCNQPFTLAPHAPWAGPNAQRFCDERCRRQSFNQRKRNARKAV